MCRAWVCSTGAPLVPDAAALEQPEDVQAAGTAQYRRWSRPLSCLSRRLANISGRRSSARQPMAFRPASASAASEKLGRELSRNPCRKPASARAFSAFLARPWSSCSGLAWSGRRTRMCASLYSLRAPAPALGLGEVAGRFRRRSPRCGRRPRVPAAAASGSARALRCGSGSNAIPSFSSAWHETPAAPSCCCSAMRSSARSS